MQAECPGMPCILEIYIESWTAEHWGNMFVR